MRGRPALDEPTATAFAVGLKLFEEMRPQVPVFVKRSKGSEPS